MTPELKQLCIEAIESALNNKNKMLLSDPPQDAWRYYRVDDKLRAALAALRAEPVSEPFGYWHKGDTEDESEFHLAADISGDCEFCLPLYLHPKDDIGSSRDPAGR